MIRFLQTKLPPALRMKRYTCWCVCYLLLGMTISFQASAQITVTGKVTSTDDGASLPGVSVLVKGTTTGTTTDTDGAYKLTVPDQNATLVFSFIGYAPQEQVVGSRTSIDVGLQADLTELSEVVVVGYGTVKKNDLTGSVGVIDPEQITKRGALNPMEAVQGQVAGVDISNSTGRAGSGFKIQIRGQQSLQGGEPLYVVDGVITGGIDFLNPQDIERIDILKDASSTAIYGSRGAYGVVLVTTKQGASVRQKAVISYDGYYGVRKSVRMPDFMPGDKWWNFRQDSFITDAIVKGTPIPANPGDNSKNSTELARRIAEKDFTNWPDLLIQDGIQQNHWVSIAGMGDNKLGYNFGVGYQQESGNIINENYKRYNFKANINHTLNERWSAGANMNFAVVDNEQGSPNAMVNAFRMSPLVKPYATDGDALLVQPGKDIVNVGKPDQITHIDFTSSSNPLLDMERASRETKSFYAIGNVYLQYSPASWINVKTTFAPRYKYEKYGEFLGVDSEGRVGGKAKATISNTESFSNVWDNQVSVNKTFNDHSFNFMGLYSLNLFEDESSKLIGDQLPSNAKSYYNAGLAPAANRTTEAAYSKSTILSYALRLNYAFKDKYLLTVSNRWDGASVLSKGNKWASFPSAAVAWKISEEGFLTDVSMLDILKIRASYGTTGNNKNVGPYDTQPTASTSTYYDFGSVSAMGVAPDGIANRNLTWEKTKELDLGLDFSFLQGRIAGSFDFYNKLSDGLIIERPLPLEAGYTSIVQNIGSVRNRGIEIGLTTVNVSTDNLSWTTTFNFAKNNNEIVDLIDGKDLPPKWFYGEPINVNYNYVFDGIWQESERELAVSYGQLPGQARVVDFDDSGTIRPDDRRIIGSPMPDWTGGFTTTVTYRNFDLTASLYTRQGVQVLSPFHQEFLNFEDRGRAKLNVDWYMQENAITETRTSNEYPQPKNGGRFWNTENVGFYKDASFVKVKNITLGYNLPGEILSRAKISSLRIYANVLNPFVFTDYDGFDPEWADASYANGGISSVTYQLGVNLKF